MRTMGSYHTGWHPITLLVSPYWRTAVPLGLKISTFLKKKIRYGYLSPLRNRKKQNPCVGQCVPVRQQNGAFLRPQLFPTTAESLTPASPSTQALASSLPHQHAFNTVGLVDLLTHWREGDWGEPGGYREQK